MNESDDKILKELKKISSWAEHQKKISKWSLIILAICIPIIIGVAIFTDYYFKNIIDDFKTETTDKFSWYDVSCRTRSGEIDEAISIAEELINITPNYPKGHTKLGFLYLTSGNLIKTKKHFKEAYRLFPSTENKENLNAILKRISQ